MGWSGENETLIEARIPSKKSKNLSSTSRNVAKTYQNLVKYDEPHVKIEFANDSFLAGNDNRKNAKKKKCTFNSKNFANTRIR